MRGQGWGVCAQDQDGFGGLPLDEEQAIEAGPLPGVGEPGEGPVEPGVGPVSHGGDEPFEDGRAGQENLALQEPGRRQVEEGARALGGEPGPGVEVAEQPEAPGSLALPYRITVE